MMGGDGRSSRRRTCAIFSMRLKSAAFVSGGMVEVRGLPALISLVTRGILNEPICIWSRNGGG
jgi:hypothetical protein